MDRQFVNRCVCSRSGDAQLPHESAVATDQIGIALSYHYTNTSLAHQLQKCPASPRHIYRDHPRHYTAAHGSDAGGFAAEHRPCFGTEPKQGLRGHSAPAAWCKQRVSWAYSPSCRLCFVVAARLCSALSCPRWNHGRRAGARPLRLAVQDRGIATLSQAKAVNFRDSTVTCWQNLLRGFRPAFNLAQ